MSGIRVFAVEDEATAAMMIADFLSEAGCDLIVTALRLDEAVAAAGRANVDVALLDINLAGEQSYPVAEILLKRQIPFLFATGYASMELPAIFQGKVVLNKPFTAEQLARALTLICANRLPPAA